MNKYSPFPTCLQPAEQTDLEHALGEYTVALDTNIFLTLFEYKKSFTEEVVSIIEAIADDERLFIPNQVAVEYQRNVETKIKESKRARQEFSRSSSNVIDDLIKATKKYNERANLTAKTPDHRHPTLMGIHKSIKEMVNEFAVELYDPNKLKDIISEIIDRNVAKKPSFKQHAKRIDEFEIRAANSIPPGYKDEHKEASWERPEGGAGDYLLWAEIIDQAKGSSCNNCLLVTNDKKSDWCDKNTNSSIEQPRRELALEYYKKTGGTIRIIDLATLVKISDVLDIKISDDSYNFAQQVGEDLSQDLFPADTYTERPSGSTATELYPCISRRPMRDADEDWDAGSWRVGKDVRQQLNPIIISEAGKVVRAWPVTEWKHEGNGYWRAEVEPALTTFEEFQDWNIPVDIGDPVPTFKGGAYSPLEVDNYGNIWRRNHLINPKEFCPNCASPVPISSTDGPHNEYGYVGYCDEDCYDEAAFLRAVEKDYSRFKSLKTE